MATITEPGIYEGIEESAYHADPVPETSLSYSGAKKMLESPARFRWEREHRVFKKAFDLGHAAHDLVLGVGASIVEIPEDILAKNGAVSTKDAKAFVDEARQAGQVPLKADDMAVIRAMAEQLSTHPIASRLLRDGTPEQSVFFRDAETSAMLRGRADWLTTIPSGPVIVDYKTTARSAAPSHFRWEARDFRYHMQDVWYREGFEAVTGDPHAFLFIVQEKEAPYLVSVVEIDDESRLDAAHLNRVARDLYVECMTTGEWPGYAPIIHPVNVPPVRL